MKYRTLTGAMADVHPSVTAERVLEAVEGEISSLDDPGICLDCGADAEGCEPDARHYECSSCGTRAVFGAEEIALMLF